jgi:uncharacterized protein (TIGR02996 family)
VTTEDDFQAALDAHPDDWQTRLVFADWLQERGDPRAEGYRALGVLKKRPFVCGFDNETTGGWAGAAWFTVEGHGEKKAFSLPSDWFKKVKGLRGDQIYVPWYENDLKRYASRRKVEDVVARAFAKLPAEYRAKLLTPPPPRKKPTRKPRK